MLGTIIGLVVLGAIIIATVVGPKNLCCWLGFHGRTLERLHGNRYHTDYHCRHCDRDVMRWNP